MKKFIIPFVIAILACVSANAQQLKQLNLPPQLSPGLTKCFQETPNTNSATVYAKGETTVLYSTGKNEDYLLLNTYSGELQYIHVAKDAEDNSYQELLSSRVNSFNKETGKDRFQLLKTKNDNVFLLYDKIDGNVKTIKLSGPDKKPFGTLQTR